VSLRRDLGGERFHTSIKYRRGRLARACFGDNEGRKICTGLRFGDPLNLKIVGFRVADRSSAYDKKNLGKFPCILGKAMALAVSERTGSLEQDTRIPGLGWTVVSLGLSLPLW